jgi:hypothetical protein
MAISVFCKGLAIECLCEAVFPLFSDTHSKRDYPVAAAGISDNSMPVIPSQIVTALVLFLSTNGHTALPMFKVSFVHTVFYGIPGN